MILEGVVLFLLYEFIDCCFTNHGETIKRLDHKIRALEGKLNDQTSEINRRLMKLELAYRERR